MAAENFESSPLTPQTKQNFLIALKNKLQNTPKNELIKILTDAAIDMQVFPAAIRGKIDPIQQAYLSHNDNMNFSYYQRLALISYFEKEGADLFIQTLDQTIDLFWMDFKLISLKPNWKSGFLFFLAKKLEIPLTPDSYVVGTIQEGKVRWRKKDPNLPAGQPQPVPRHDFPYNKATCWRMLVEDFEKFKKTGKRGGNGEITKQRFVNHFDPDFRYQAGFVWDDLWKLKIITQKNRLSQTFRVLTGNKLTVPLPSLTNEACFITKSRVISALNQLRGRNKKKPITKNEFLACFDALQRVTAEKIWDQTIVGKVIDANGIITKDLGREFNISDFLIPFKLTYSQISNALYTLSQGTRSERTKKLWSEEKNVSQAAADAPVHCTKDFDVSVYKDMITHDVTDDGIENDHIPSKALLENYKKKLIAEIIDVINAYVLSLEALPFVYENDEFTAEELQQLKALEATNTTELGKHRQLLQDIKNENGNHWWTAALSEEMHSQGLTYKRDETEQVKSVKDIFHDEAAHYLKQTKTQGSHLEVVGSLRFLYRSQVKKHDPIGEHKPIGQLPFLLFSRNDGLRNKTDSLFNTTIRQDFDEQEGLIKPTEARKLEF